MTAGYSETPLVRKLGIKPGSRIHTIDAPRDYWELIGELPPDARAAEEGERELEIVHFFVTTEDAAVAAFEAGRERIAPNGMIWASWPKKSSGVPSELDGNRVRHLGLERGLVDIKVCAVDETWSGLKFVIPVADRE
jgi:hypothetical protein